MRPELRVLKDLLAQSDQLRLQIAEMRPELRVLKVSISFMASLNSPDCRDATRIEGTESVGGSEKGAYEDGIAEMRPELRVLKASPILSTALPGSLQRCDPN